VNILPLARLAADFHPMGTASSQLLDERYKLARIEALSLPRRPWPVQRVSGRKRY
jgi:hypothetical protein